MFKDATIDEDEYDKVFLEEVDKQKGNPIPKGVVSLEKVFDLQNKF